MPPSTAAVKHLIRTFDFRKLFVQSLGWDRFAGTPTVTAAGREWSLTGVAEKKGVRAFVCPVPTAADLPSATDARAVAAALADDGALSVLVFHDTANTRQAWQFTHRATAAEVHRRRVVFDASQSGEALAQELARVSFDLAEEESLTHVDAAARLRAVAQVEKTTKRFFNHFQAEHAAFHEFIAGLDNAVSDRAWYASLMLNRLMFVYFIQKKGFLDNNPDYLRAKLREVQARRGKGQFLTFYTVFLKKLFHDGLGKKPDARTAELAALIGIVPYLNGGLFDVHVLERRHPAIDIPDEAFERLFTFFDRWNWHLDDRPLRRDDEINPDVLGYIFEQYINKKQMGAYYTKEDVTGYITRNTLLPFVLTRAAEECAVAFVPGGPVWRLLRDDPDRYIYPAVRHGVDLPLPPDIEAGVADVARRGGWNRTALDGFGLPTETWRELVARRQRCAELRRKLAAAGEVTSVNDLVTLNLDIVRFATDVIVECEGSDLLLAVWNALNQVSVLDPTCGSGAFLFAALNLLAPLYDACLDRMAVFVKDAEKLDGAAAKKKFPEFRAVLAEVKRHPSRRYFVLRSVVVNNLYGVDLMAEAVEICKLRLFLKLVAQVDQATDLEPLPDIDFNVRPGNTLVGFATPAATRAAVGMLNYAQLDDIEAAAAEVERKCRLYRQYHVQLRDDQLRLSFTKQELQADLDGLRAKLDRFLASAYGVPDDDPAAVAAWRASHQPFHWWVEFHSILARGGFDVIVGNPPWKEYAAVRRDYTVRGFATEACGNLHGICTERAMQLATPAGGRIGFIVQLPLVSSSRMVSVRRHLTDHSATLCAIPFDDRPGKLFEGLEHCRSTIFIAERCVDSSSDEHELVVAAYQRWPTASRDTLFERLELVPLRDRPLQPDLFPKVASPHHRSVLNKLAEANDTCVGDLKASGESPHYVFYQEATQYWAKATVGLPHYAKNGVVAAPAHGRYLHFPNAATAQVVAAVLNSSLFYLYFVTYSDGFHLSDGLATGFPLAPGVAADKQLATLGKRLMSDLVANAERTVINTKSGDRIEYDEFYGAKSKPLIDQIDAALAAHYGFSVEELDFIRNYDVKYRLGADADAAD